MKFLIPLLLSIPVFAQWTKDPKVQLFEESFSDSTYTISTRETQNIFYPSAYDIYIESDQKNVSSSKKSQNDPVCTFDQRRLKIEKALQIEIPRTDLYFFTDFALYQDFNKAYLVRNDLMVSHPTILYDKQLFEITYQFDIDGYLELLSGNFQSYFKFSHLLDSGGSSNQIDYLEQENKRNRNLNPLFFKDPVGQTAYIITEIGGISILAESIPVNESKSVKPVTLKKRQKVQKVLYSQALNLVLVANGEGIDCYHLNRNDRQLDYRYTVEIQNEQKQILEIVNAVLSNNETQLYIIDNSTGIHFVDLTINNYVKHISEKLLKSVNKFFIPVENPISFAFRNSSFIVVAQTSQKINFAVEILINLNTLEYTYNRFYLEDMQLFDVQLQGDLGFLIGYDVHKIIYLGIYKGTIILPIINLGFVDKYFDFDYEFVEPNLKRVTLLEHKISEQRGKVYNYMFAMSADQFKTYLIGDVAPHLICESNIQMQASFVVKINATTCASKTDASPFSMCHLNHKFTLDIYEVSQSINNFQVLIESDQLFTVEVTAIIFFSIFLITLISGFCFCWKWRRVLLLLNTQKAKMEQQKKYAEIQEQKDQELQNQEHQNPPQQDKQ